MAKEQWLVRAPDGTMATVVAHSDRGAVKLYLYAYGRRLQPGDYISVQPRGHGDWTDFKVS